MTDLRTQIRSSIDCDASRDAVQLYYVYCTNTDGLVPGSWSRHPLLRHASRDVSSCSSLLFYKAGTMISNNVYTFLDIFTISQLYTHAATMISNNVYTFPGHVHKFTIVNVCRDRPACALNGSAHIHKRSIMHF